LLQFFTVSLLRNHNSNLFSDHNNKINVCHSLQCPLCYSNFLELKQSKQSSYFRCLCLEVKNLQMDFLVCLSWGLNLRSFVFRKFSHTSTEPQQLQSSTVNLQFSDNRLAPKCLSFLKFRLCHHLLYNVILKSVHLSDPRTPNYLRCHRH
jgi:hypothetical protein